MRYLILLFLLSFTQTAFGEGTSFFHRLEEGWFWGHDQKAQKLTKTEEEKKQTPSQEVEAIKKTFEQKLHKALMKLDLASANELQEYQQQILERSEKLGELMQLATLYNDKINSNIANPTSHYARQVVQQQQLAKQIAQIQQLASSYGLVYFHKKDCQFCQIFSPIVSNFAKHFGFEVMAVSIDGSSNPYFSNNQFDNGLAEMMNISSVPALIAFDTENNRYFPIAKGAVSEDEIMNNISLLLNTQEVINAD
jgi:conjugal transfer pilus assembly protein TraF